MRPKFLLLLLLNILLGSALFAQTSDLAQWQSHPYGNQWIDYTKDYVRVGVKEDGVYKVAFSSLTSSVPGIGSNNFQIWHRGKQVTPLEVTSTHVTFWAKKNDGVSDGLMFTSVEDRLDITTSFYSNEASYFFTTGTPATIPNVNGTPNAGTTAETYHTETITVNYSKFAATGDRSHQTNTPLGEKYKYIDFVFNSAGNASGGINQSLYERNGAFVTGIVGPGSGNTAFGTTEFREEFLLLDRYSTEELSVELEYAIYGNSELPNTSISGKHHYGLHSSDSEVTLFDNEKLLTERQLDDFEAFTEIVTLEAGTHFNNSTGAGLIGIKSRNSDGVFLDRYGIAFYQIRYSQQLVFNSDKYKIFQFNNNASGKRKISISNVPSNPVVFDISDRFGVRKITNFTVSSNTLTFDIDRTTNQPLTLLVTSSSGANDIATNQIYDVDFTPLATHTNKPAFIDGEKINPNGFEYLIITHDNSSKPVLEGAREYAAYRGSSAGGSHNTLLISMRNIYNQFNYGEPSPMAIRRFVDYMLSGSPAVRQGHAVLLIGHAVSHPTRIQAELPDEVPTFGDPGSDALLVGYLTNSPHSDPNTPAIPLGRITAFNSTEVRNYLNKVKIYENQSASGDEGALAWRKKGLQIVGAKNYSELAPFNGYFSTAETKMKHTSETFKWLPSTIDNRAVSFPGNSGIGVPAKTAEPAVRPYMEDGIGFLTYYGHGNRTTVQYNFETPDRYTFMEGRFPFVYITGCGIGNAYNRVEVGRVTRWVTDANRGAIAIIANSFDAYTLPAANYMSMLYERVFTQYDNQRKTIGEIWVDVAKAWFEGSEGGRIMVNETELAHTHQTNLFGDPLMSILNTNSIALPVKLSHFDGRVYENRSILLGWETQTEINSHLFEIQRSTDGKKFQRIGEVAAKGNSDEPQTYNFIDREPLAGINYYRLKQIDKASGANEGKFEYSDVISIAMELEERINFFPNPTTDKVNFTNLDPARNYRWTVYSISGSQVLKGKELEFSIKSLPPGVYVVELVDDKNAVSRKRIIKH